MLKYKEKKDRIVPVFYPLPYVASISCHDTLPMTNFAHATEKWLSVPVPVDLLEVYILHYTSASSTF